jgi:hypothetical protein
VTKGLDNAIEQIQTYALAAGCKSAPAEVTEGAGNFPFAVSYPLRGTISVDDASAGRDIHTLASEVHVGRQHLGNAVELAKTVLIAFGLLLKQNPKLNGTVDTIDYPIRYTFGSLSWANVPTVGFRFEIDIKIRGSLST